MNKSTATPHHGKNVKRMREIMGVKQEALAGDLGMSQQAVSLLEQKEELDADLIERIAVILGLPEEVITNMTDDGMMNFFTGTFTNNDHSSSVSNLSTNNNCTFNINPVEKWMEAMAENKRLYERLIAAEKEKVELLERLLGERK